MDAIKKYGEKKVKMATQVVHKVYVSCALMNINLQVPDLVLSYVHKTLVVNFMLFFCP